MTRFVTTASTGASSARERDDATARLDVDRANLEVAKKALELAIAGPREEDLDQARAELAMRRADLQLLQKRLDDCELHAPSNGVVQTRILEPGEMASPDRPVLNVALTDPKWVRAYVSEGDLGRIRGGQRATVASDSFGGRDYEGRVGFISSVVEFTPKTVETEEPAPSSSTRSASSSPTPRTSCARHAGDRRRRLRRRRRRGVARGDARRSGALSTP